MLVCAFPYPFCTRDRGCSAHPAFPASSFEGQRNANLGCIAPRDGELVFVKLFDWRHSIHVVPGSCSVPSTSFSSKGLCDERPFRGYKGATSLDRVDHNGRCLRRE